MPTAQFPSNVSACASSAVPIGATIQLYYDKTHRGAVCKVVGLVADSHHIVDVSQAVRNQLGFKSTTMVRVYRVLGNVNPCNVAPPPGSCMFPPAACIANVPNQALVVCVK
jgi:hypothetical protein